MGPAVPPSEVSGSPLLNSPTLLSTWQGDTGWSLPLLYLSLEVACDPWSQPTGAEGQEAEVGVEVEEQAGRWRGQAPAAVHFLSPSCSLFTALA